MTTTTCFSPTTACLKDASVTCYPAAAPFDPPERYPELGPSPCDPTNLVYPLVRRMLVELGLDAPRFGTPDWNPLAGLIAPGDHVLVKPNLVTHRHYRGEEAFVASVTHPSVVRPLVDYAMRALRGTGRVTIADNPVENADFAALLAATGLGAMVQTLCSRGERALELIDLRPRVLRDDEHGGFVHVAQEGDPLGYVTVDLERDSLFAPLDGPDTHYYTLADATIDHLDPHCVRESRTDAWHHVGCHRYLISCTVLDADVIINVAKMKTHCKAGVSMALKNMIGVVYEKECIPHHRPGASPQGDSFPRLPPSYYTASRKLYRSLRRTIQIHRFPGFTVLRDLMQGKGVLIGQHIEHGNWKGNDTLWRTILDLNRIVLYADKNGTMRDEPQRRLLHVIDGVIAQEGEGPMAGVPFVASALLAGFNPVLTDARAARMMGVDIRTLPVVMRANEAARWRIVEPGFDANALDWDDEMLHFAMPKGWC
jgi:uncharacterized protein (DUF362 family)